VQSVKEIMKSTHDDLNHEQHFDHSIRGFINRRWAEMAVMLHYIRIYTGLDANYLIKKL
jgi:hypothetical protein